MFISRDLKSTLIRKDLERKRLNFWERSKKVTDKGAEILAMGIHKRLNKLEELSIFIGG